MKHTIATAAAAFSLLTAQLPARPPEAEPAAPAALTKREQEVEHKRALAMDMREIQRLLKIDDTQAAMNLIKEVAKNPDSSRALETGISADGKIKLLKLNAKESEKLICSAASIQAAAEVKKLVLNAINPELKNPDPKIFLNILKEASKVDKLGRADRSDVAVLLSVGTQATETGIKADLSKIFEKFGKDRPDYKMISTNFDTLLREFSRQ